jgi:hypothetical protein
MLHLLPSIYVFIFIFANQTTAVGAARQKLMKSDLTSVKTTTTVATTVVVEVEVACVLTMTFLL